MKRAADSGLKPASEFKLPARSRASLHASDCFIAMAIMLAVAVVTDVNIETQRPITNDAATRMSAALTPRN